MPVTGRLRGCLSGVAFLVLFLSAPAVFAATSVRFHGNGTGDIDRIKIPIDDPGDANAGPPADVGAADFTIEFWMKASAADNTAAAVACGSNTDWLSGNVVVDRNRWNADRKFGVAVAGGRVVFGVSGDGTGDLTICGARAVLDDAWHHVAVERERATGKMWIYVDGMIDAQGDGPAGDVSYPDDGVPAAPNDPFLVFGAEKYDSGPQSPPYDGFLDEIRISTTRRYTGPFSRPRLPFAPDTATAALYHLDEGTGDAVGDSSGASGGPSDGGRQFGGSPAGPEWAPDVPPLGGNPGIALTPVTTGVSSPVQVTNAADGSGRLFIVEQGGKIRIFKNGALLSTPYLDIHTLVSNGGEEGLLSVAFHPNYASNGYFYVYYTDNIATPGDITVARYHVSANPDVADGLSGQILLVVPHPVNANHNGGQLFFGPNDGYLYMGTGDGGGGGDVPNNAQNKNILLGKILRLDVDGTGAVPCGQSVARPYAIPASNPFAGAVAGCDEIWAYGVRNPWRFSFDRSSGDLLIGDVGQDAYEEVDYQLASSAGGENYGWHRMEGFHCFNPATGCDDGTLTLPVLEYTHSVGCSITGGYRYRGADNPGLFGLYFYADFCGGQIFAGRQAANGTWADAQLLNSGYNVSAFGEDESGELYVCDLSGGIYKVDQLPNPTPAAASLSPAQVIAGDPGFTLTVNGSGFVYGSTVRWNGQDRPTTLVSSSKLTADISAADIQTAGTASIAVFSPTPGGGVSNSQTLNINPTFLDVPLSYFAYSYIQAVFDAGVTAGCAPRLYCPGSPTTRAQMAVFLLKASLTSSYTPPPCTGAVFGDVPCSGGVFDPWIEDLAGRGITGGCGGGDYCPAMPVARAQMAVFLLKTSQGSGYTPPACAGTVFNDVPCTGGIYDAWIEDLAGRGVTGGCGGSNYCPDSPVTRGQMAVFLTKMFSLPLP